VRKRPTGVLEEVLSGKAAEDRHRNFVARKITRSTAGVFWTDEKKRQSVADCRLLL